MSLSRGSAEGEEQRRGIMMPEFNISLTQKQLLEYVRPQGNQHLQIFHIACFLTCLYHIYVPHRLTRGDTRNNHRKLLQVYFFRDDVLQIIVTLS